MVVEEKKPKADTEKEGYYKWAEGKDKGCRIKARQGIIRMERWTFINVLGNHIMYHVKRDATCKPEICESVNWTLLVYKFVRDTI